MTLRQRLTSSYVMVAAAGILLAAVIGVFLARMTQVRSAQQAVRHISTAAAATLDGTPSGSEPSVPTIPSSEGVRLFLVDGSNTVVSDSRDDLVGADLSVLLDLLEPASGSKIPVQRIRFSGESLLFTLMPVDVAAASNLRLIVGVPAAGLLDSWLVTLGSMLLLALVGVLLSGAIGWYLSGDLSSPIRTLADAATRMSQGNYDERINNPSPFVEFQSLSKAFNMMADEVRTARQTQRDFLANVSHDLRTPLTSIQGFSQAMMDRAVPDEQIARVAGIIHNEASHLSRLVQDLLDLARIEAGRFSMTQRDINLRMVLERCSRKLKTQADAMGIEFETNIPRRALPVRGDADRLEQVVTNLVDNAFSYARSGGGHVKLTGLLGGIRGRSAKPAGNGHSNGKQQTGEQDAVAKLGRWWVEIRVEDDGPGITAEQKPAIFERVYRSDDDNSGSNSGLGLAIAREIVEAHGGVISVDDCRNTGTEFIVRLPMKMR